MEISLICVGKIKEQYIVDGINEYTKRIKPFCDFKIIELKEFNNEKALELEADKILEVIKKAGFSVPTFCYRPDLTQYGACRMCVVEVKYPNGRKMIMWLH